MRLTTETPSWKQEHIDRLHDWCSARELDPNTIAGKLAFVVYQLRNVYACIGRNLDKAQTYDAAKEGVEPFVNLLSETISVRFHTPKEAKAIGYNDPGNPELRDEAAQG